jgi:predicted phage baseplate assembly protein
VTFPDIAFDERDFQALVNEARGRVAVQCPEWTEHNVSDPGITLIETFAWMTEMLVYRLNRVPDKLHVALLKLLGIELAPPAAATADLRFMLAAPAAAPIVIPGHETEVTARGAVGDEPVVFRVQERFTIAPLRPTAFLLQRGGTVAAIPVVDGTARAAGAGEPAYSSEPRVDDALYIGFGGRLDRLVLRVEVEGSRAQGVGIDPDAPPLRWEVPQGNEWVPTDVISDTTGGFNKPQGAIELQMPRRTSEATVGGRKGAWVRCRVDELTRFGLPSPRYTHPPRIHSITASVIGALVPAEDARTVVDEVLGESDGTPGQTFRLRHTPAIEMRDDETLEVRDPGESEWKAWERREAFDASDPADCHYRFDAAAGEIELGPAIRARRKGWLQHGRIPPKGAQLRMSRYRYGGGVRGSVPARTLTELRNPVPGVATVTNPRSAEGAVEAETLDVGRLRAAYELRTRYRAVTAEDFEFLAVEGSVKVKRARCIDPEPGRATPVYVLPAVANAARALSYDELTAEPELLEEVAAYLDERRLVGTQVDVKPVPLRGVTVVADVLIERTAHTDVVAGRIRDALYRFVNPLVGGSLDGEGEGWEFGRPLNDGELYGLVHDVPGVSRVWMVRMYETNPATPGQPEPEPVGSRFVLEPHELLCSATHRVRARHPDATG